MQKNTSHKDHLTETLSKSIDEMSEKELRMELKRRKALVSEWVNAITHPLVISYFLFSLDKELVYLSSNLASLATRYPLCLFLYYSQDKRRAAELRKLEREQQQAEKKHKKEMEQAKKQAASASRKEDQPAERLKLMVIILDVAISENADFMSSLASECKEMGVGYRIAKDELPPGGILWKRKQSDRSVDENAQVETILVTSDCKLTKLRSCM